MVASGLAVEVLVGTVAGIFLIGVVWPVHVRSELWPAMIRELVRGRTYFASRHNATLGAFVGGRCHNS